MQIVLTGMHQNGSRITIAGPGAVGFDDAGSLGIEFEKPPEMVVSRTDCRAYASHRGPRYSGRGLSSPFGWRNKPDMRNWGTNADETKPGWFWVEAALATMVVIAGYVGLGWTAFGWLADHLT